MLEAMQSLADFLGLAIQKLFIALPSSAIDADDVTAVIESMNSENHFLNYLNWFVPIEYCLTVFELWIGTIIAAYIIILIINFIMKKFGG